MGKTIKVGDIVEVLNQSDKCGPQPGHRGRIDRVDDSCVPYRIEWRDGGWWFEPHDIRLVGSGEASSPCAIMTLLQAGWSVSAASSSHDGSSVLVWRHDDCDLTVEIGGGTVDLVGQTRSPDQFTPAELRAFATLAEETA